MIIEKKKLTQKDEIKSTPKRKPAKKDSGKPFWKMLLVALGLMIWVGVAVIASQLAIGYAMVWMLGPNTFVEPLPTAIYSALSYIVAMLLIILVPIGLKRTRKTSQTSNKERGEVGEKGTLRNSLGLHGWPTWTDIGLAPVGFIVYFLLAAALTAVFTAFPWFDAEQVQEVGFSVYSVGIDRVIAFVILVVVAPVAEEIIFRGWLYDKLRGLILEKYSNIASMIVANLLVSLLFGLVHMQWNVGVNVFAMSVVLCALREITGTIYAGIILHMLKNGIAFYLLYVIGVG